MASSWCVWHKKVYEVARFHSSYKASSQGLLMAVLFAALQLPLLFNQVRPTERFFFFSLSSSSDFTHRSRTRRPP